MFNVVFSDVSYAGFAMRGEILGVERRRFWHDDEKLEIVMSVGVFNAVQRHGLWRAVDANSDALETLVQGRRNAYAAKRFLRKLSGSGACHELSCPPLVRLRYNALPGSR